VTAQQEAARKLLDRITKVRPIRATAQRVMLLSGEQDVNVTRVADAISADPALAAETMRIANSAVFRRGEPIDNLHRAVMTLGLQQIHSMATSMAIMSALESSGPLFGRLQSEAVLAGSVAGLLATEANQVEKGTAFLAGLLGEIGAMACLAVDAPYAVLYREAGGDPAFREERELARYGMASRVVGAGLLRRNQLPEPICCAVEASWDLRDQDAGMLARIAVFSRRVAPDVVQAAGRDDLDELGPRIAEIAEDSAIVEISPERLLGLCSWAAASASFTIESAR